MAVIPFKDLDVYAIVDQDTDEARGFTTYLGYWDCLAELVARGHGVDPYGSILASLRANRTVAALSGRRFTGSTAELRGLLLNAWNSELTLYLVGPGDPKLQTANQWNSVYAYYATGRAALAWLVARDGVAPSAHRPLLRALATQVAGRNPLLPEPWSLTCTRLDPLMYSGFTTPPAPCSNLASSVPPHDRLGLLLKTTRARRIDALVADEKRRRKLSRAPNGERARQDAVAYATTLFDFTWRSRTRANYGDPSMYTWARLRRSGPRRTSNPSRRSPLPRCSCSRPSSRIEPPPLFAMPVSTSHRGIGAASRTSSSFRGFARSACSEPARVRTVDSLRRPLRVAREAALRDRLLL